MGHRSSMDEDQEGQNSMYHAAGDVNTERRRQPDRRAHSTTFWSALRFDGRRKGFRRAGEERMAYVDSPSQRVVMLLFIVIGASVLDALFTLLFLQDGGGEANPLMAVILNHGYTPFVGIKMALTGIGAWFLAAHQHLPLAIGGLYVLAVGYMGLLGIHAAILLK
jgi:hypothetical protein